MSGLGFAFGDPLAWLPPVAIITLALNGLRLRGRATRLRAVPPGGGPALRPEEQDPAAAWEWLTAAGVDLPAATRRALTAHATANGLQVLDVIPSDLALDAALGLLRMVDPVTYRTAPLEAGWGAGQAVAVARDTLQRAEVKPAEALDPAAVLTDTVALKKFAPLATDLVTVPGLVAGDPGSPRARRLALGIPASFSLPGPLIGYAVLAVGALANPVWGLISLGAFTLQPYLVFAGTPLRPRDLHRSSLLRVVRDPIQWVRSAWGRPGPVAAAESARKQAHIDDARPGYAADIAAGVDRFLEPRRADCPWCGAGALATIVRTPDLHQGKPGRFRLDRCRSCGHVFQNPRLTIAGLDFYYRDFYDGAGDAQLEAAFGAQAKVYRNRAETLRGHAQSPGSWLDVGTGHGHFCLVASGDWPGTTFDGLDMTDGIDEAARRGWVHRGYRGMFPELAPDLAGRYDVVSMFHYLEHTREPAQELDAAAAVLKPGGHLLIEVPDPEWPMGRVLRRFWMPWLQPQHQHLIPIGNLKKALAERGLTVLAERRDMAAVPPDLIAAVYLLLHRLTTDPNTPWRRSPPGPGRQLLRGLGLIVAVPLAILAAVLNPVFAIPLRRSGRTTAYRVVARREPAAP
ncbi:MAG TPA: class I SAM-dependent methyltransferase [Acidimicrobiia bacterium]|nr:class I SAM-dependent methyltransferase [Acidimicrobiia bacterium]